VEISNLILRERGEIYGLINNAAVGHDGLLATQHNSEIEELILVNLLAPIVLAKYFSRSMLTQNSGRIVNISSIVANTGYRGLSVYASTKGGLISFSRSLARDLGAAKITVNSILPGFMVSDMTSSLSLARMEKVTSRSPLGKLVDFQDVSALVVYLLNDSGAHITGASFTVDAGNSA
jgi:3-oxoacyl-[acyl-carrier protein] reductase